MGFTLDSASVVASLAGTTRAELSTLRLRHWRGEDLTRCTCLVFPNYEEVEEWWWFVVLFRMEGWRLYWLCKT